MDWLKSLYPEVHHVLQAAIPAYWPELKSVFGTLFETPLKPVAMLPMACCQAVNGRARDAVPVSAALTAAGIGIRILDDLEDKDRSEKLWQKVGEARAWNYAAALQVLSFEILSQAPFSPQVFRRVNQLFIDAFFYVALGQERDISGTTRTIEDYWRTIELKTATAYAVTCASGAMVGTDNADWIEACRVFGHHIGLAVQIFNDMESIWQPEGTTDLEQGKITLPLLYGLSCEHLERDELASIVEAKAIATHATKIKEILDRIDTRTFLVWATLKEREQALDAIRICPNAEGREALECYATGMFGDIDSLLEEVA